MARETSKQWQGRTRLRRTGGRRKGGESGISLQRRRGRAAGCREGGREDSAGSHRQPLLGLQGVFPCLLPEESVKRIFHRHCQRGGNYESRIQRNREAWAPGHREEITLLPQEQKRRQDHGGDQISRLGVGKGHPINYYCPGNFLPSIQGKGSVGEFLVTIIF